MSLHIYNNENGEKILVACGISHSVSNSGSSHKYPNSKSVIQPGITQLNSQLCIQFTKCVCDGKEASSSVRILFESQPGRLLKFLPYTVLQMCGEECLSDIVS